MPQHISNFTDILTQQAKIQPETIAVYAPKGSLTYRQLETLVWKMATLLHKQEIKTGDIVALTFKNELILLITMLAVARVGATVFSLPKDTPRIQKESMFSSLKVNFLITDMVKNRDTSLTMLFMDMKTLIQDQTEIDLHVRTEAPDTPWHFITGSGSTGKSKIMPIHHHQQIERMHTALKWLPLSKGDRVATLVNLDHYVSKSLYLDTISAGLSIVLFDRTETIKPVPLCRKYNISLLHATVFHIHMILKNVLEPSNHLFPSLKALVIGGSSVPDPLRKQIEKSLTPNLYIRYGVNEVGTISAAHTPEVYDTPGTVGKVLVGKTVEIVDEKLQPLPAENVGTIRIKSATLIDGYLDNEDATQRAIKDGWFYPGDLGKFTLDGQLIHLGRSDDMIIMAGNNIYPAEIEHTIMSHPKVKDAAAISIKAPLAQEVPVCAVVLHESEQIKEKELLAFSYQHLGSRGPKRIAIVKSLDRNEQGKLSRASLKEKIKTLLQIDNSL